MSRKIAFAAIALWIVTIAVLAVVFIRGNGHMGSDGRTVIRLHPAERDFVLAEMRGMLIAVKDISAALAMVDDDAAAKAARAAGGDSVGGVPVSLMTKLPVEFKHAGMTMHAGFDDFAAAASRGESQRELTAKLSNLLGNCVACHQTYRIDPED